MSQSKKRRNPLLVLFEYRMFIILVLMFIILAIASQGLILQKNNLISLLTQNSIIGIVAIGQFLVILTGGIDLSVGSVLMISSLCYVSVQQIGVPASILLSICVGLAFGFSNGQAVTRLKINPFIATLAFSQIATGLGYIMVNGQPIFNVASSFLAMGQFKIGGMSVYVYLWLLLCLAFALVLQFSGFGVRLYCVGGNEQTARLSGLSSARVKTAAYMLSGALCGLAGALYTSRLQLADPTIGGNFSMDSITAVVIGGASLAGGEGKLHNTLLGVLILGMLNNFMNIIGVPSSMQVGVKGCILIATVLLNHYVVKKTG